MPKTSSELKRHSFLLGPDTLAALQFLAYTLARSGGTHNLSHALLHAIIETAKRFGYEQK